MSVLQQFVDLRPAGGFGLIMADPPWSFDNWSAKGEAKNAKAHYDCEPWEAIAGLPVSALAADDCLLWLWATNPMLPQALAVMSAWGFTFKTAGHWVKRTVNGKIAFGPGYVLRCAGEPFLFGTKGTPLLEGDPFLIGSIGKPKTVAKNVRSVIEGPIRDHSRKPDEAFAAAEALMPDVRRIELFSREFRPGWACWGNEIGKFNEPIATAREA